MTLITQYYTVFFTSTLLEVSALEADVLGGQSMQESLKNSQAKMDSAVRDVYLSLTAASGKTAPS